MMSLGGVSGSSAPERPRGTRLPWPSVHADVAYAFLFSCETDQNGKGQGWPTSEPIPAHALTLERPCAPVLAAVVALLPFSRPIRRQRRPLGNRAGPSPTRRCRRDTSEKVVDVQIRGNKSLPLDKILPQIRTRAGRPFDLELIEEDVRRLDHTHMFVNVQTYWQQVPGGRIVIFDVLERPLLQDVLFVGCKEIRKKTLQKEAEVKVGDPVDPFAIEEARRKLEEFYHTKGFTGARITLLEGDKPEDRRAIFLINEGDEAAGVERAASSATPSPATTGCEPRSSRSHPFLYLFGGEFDRKQLDEDVERLTAYYRGLGFFRARIGREFEFNEKQNWVTITFVIDEGPRYKIRNVSVIGNTKYTSDELLADLKLKSGEYFNQAKMTARRRHAVRTSTAASATSSPTSRPTRGSSKSRASSIWSTTSRKATATAWARSTSTSRASIRTRKSPRS